MLGEPVAGDVVSSHPCTLTARLVNLGDDGLPHRGMRGVVGHAYLAADAQDRADGRTPAREERTTEEDHGRRAVAGDVGPGRVDDVGQVDLGKNSSISFLPNSRFMNELAVICPV